MRRKTDIAEGATNQLAVVQHFEIMCKRSRKHSAYYQRKGHTNTTNSSPPRRKEYAALGEPIKTDERIKMIVVVLPILNTMVGGQALPFRPWH